jgi:cell division septum initiation protein DivIVA
MNHLTNLKNSVRIYLQDMEDLFSLLEELTVLTTEEPRTIIGPLTYGLDKAAVTELIEKIRNSLPRELRNASENAKQAELLRSNAKAEFDGVVANAQREADRILADAKTEAEGIIAQAELDQEKLVSESTTLNLAKQQAESIMNEASSKAELIQQDALKYATRLLSTVQETAEKVSRMTAEANSKISKESPNKIPSNAERSNDRIRV